MMPILPQKDRLQWRVYTWDNVTTADFGNETKVQRLHHAENDLDDLPPDFDALNEHADYVSTAMPVGVCQMRDRRLRIAGSWCNGRTGACDAGPYAKSKQIARPVGTAGYGVPQR